MHVETTTTQTHTVTLTDLTDSQLEEVSSLALSWTESRQLTALLDSMSEREREDFAIFERVAREFAVISMGRGREISATERKRWLEVPGLVEDEVNGEYYVFQCAAGDLQHTETLPLLQAWLHPTGQYGALAEVSA